MGVHLREKKVKGGKVSFYLDIYHNGKRKCESLNIHHTLATNVLEHSPSGDLYTVSKLLGHTSIIATQIYAKVRDKRKVEAVDALPMLNRVVKNNENTPVVVMQPKRGRKRIDQSKAA